MRASEASELRKLRYFYILKLLFLSIFCRYIRCFVGTKDMLVGLHVPTNISMYRQISKCTDKSPKRHYWGGGGGGAIAPCPPPPPSGYANDPRYGCSRQESLLGESQYAVCPLHKAPKSQVSKTGHKSQLSSARWEIVLVCLRHTVYLGILLILIIHFAQRVNYEKKKSFTCHCIGQMLRKV